jgi:hypothetical protein
MKSLSALIACFLIIASCGTSKKAATGIVFKPGKYYNFALAPDFAEWILLKKDSSFRYEFSFSNGQRFVNGKWTLMNDTIFLYEYKKPNVISSVKENITSSSDSIRIIFNMGELNGQRIRLTDYLEVILNGDCNHKFVPNERGEVVLPKQPVYKIEFNYGQYLVNNTRSNEIIFNLNPLIYTVSPKDLKQDKWVFSGSRLYKIDCGIKDTVTFLEFVPGETELQERLSKLKK